MKVFTDEKLEVSPGGSTQKRFYRVREVNRRWNKAWTASRRPNTKVSASERLWTIPVMFCYTGLTKAQVLYVREKYAVYLLGSGVFYFCDCQFLTGNSTLECSKIGWWGPPLCENPHLPYFDWIGPSRSHETVRKGTGIGSVCFVIHPGWPGAIVSFKSTTYLKKWILT